MASFLAVVFSWELLSEIFLANNNEWSQNIFLFVYTSGKKENLLWNAM